MRRRCRCPHANAEHRNDGSSTTPIIRCKVPGCGCEFGPARRFAHLYPAAAQLSAEEPTLYERFSNEGF
jgi:hypothetical protein